MKPRVIITIGDPSGVGPEVTLKALASPEVRGLADFLVIGDGSVVEALRRDMGLTLKAPLLDMENIRPRSLRYGVSRAVFGMASMQYIDSALRLFKGGGYDCLVTAPVNKSSVIAAGFSGFLGHTEYLASRTGTRDYAMMFVGRSFKITPVTRHIALKDVPGRIDSGMIYRAIDITGRSLRGLFGIRNPRIAVAGLNPHAGEGGAFGWEEASTIAPAIRRASRRFGGVRGPFPPDVVFHDALMKKSDAVVAMYHDQALIPFKLLHFRDCVNMTLGLPFIRTSPDHGTAFDIAGKGEADASSMRQAIILACRLSKRRRPLRPAKRY